jgi:hypothetical protein
MLVERQMFDRRFLRFAAIALIVYGILGLAVAAAITVVGISAFRQLNAMVGSLDQERDALVQVIRTASAAVRDSAAATSDFQTTIGNAADVADQASRLANDSAGTFRELSTTFASLNIFGVQLLAGIAPQFSRSADQLQQIAISLGATRDALGQNRIALERVGGDLGQLQTQLDLIASRLSQRGNLGLDPRSLLFFQLTFFGLCLLVLLQSAFSLVAGVALHRLRQTLGQEPLFPVRTATTIDEGDGGRARVY